MELNIKTYWLTDRQSQCDFDFDFDFQKSPQTAVRIVGVFLGGT
jgi:hypothetical protein